MWYIYMMQCYSVVKKDETMNFVAKWVKMEKIELREITKTRKDKDCMFFLTGGS